MKKILITAIAALAIAGTPTAASAQTDAITITLIQGIRTPPNIDVTVDGATVTGSTNLAQGSVINATDYAGTTPTLEAFETGTTSSVMAAEVVSVPSSGNNSIVLTTAGAMIFANNMGAVAEGTARLTLRNSSTDASSVNLVGASQPINGVGLGAEGSIDEPAGSLSSAQIIDSAGAPLVDIASTNLAPGTNTIIYLIGDATLGYDYVQQVIELPVTPTDTTTTTIVDGSTTSTTSTSTTSTTSTSTTSTAVPAAVNTGSPIDDGNSMLWVLIIIGGVAVAGGAYFVRRKV